MPIYEYRCTQCGHDFELHQQVGDPVPACPLCGSPSRKVYSSVGLIFRGSGFHTTDYRKPAASEDGAKPAATEQTESKDPKPASKPASEPAKSPQTSG